MGKLGSPFVHSSRKPAGTCCSGSRTNCRYTATESTPARRRVRCGGRDSQVIRGPHYRAGRGTGREELLTCAIGDEEAAQVNAGHVFCDGSVPETREGGPYVSGHTAKPPQCSLATGLRSQVRPMTIGISGYSLIFCTKTNPDARVLIVCMGTDGSTCNLRPWDELSTSIRPSPSTYQ